MKNREDHNEKKVKNAKRALDRVQAESETVGNSSFARIANKSRAHFAAHDVDQSDSVVVWGSRIGRLLGLVFAIALLIYLIATYL